MIIDMTSKPEMRDILTAMKGKTFKSYECVLDRREGPMSTFERLRINLGQKAVDVSCDQHYVESFFGSPNDVAIFECAEVELDSAFHPGVAAEPKKYLVNERITGVFLVSDRVVVTDGGSSDEMRVDVAFAIETKNAVYTFARGIWFSGVIDIRMSDHVDIPYTTDKCNDDWTDDPEEGNAVAETIRTMIRLA